MLWLRDFVRISTLVSVLLVSFCAGAPASRKSSLEVQTLTVRQESSSLELRRAIQATSQSPDYLARSLRARVWKLDYLDEGYALYFSTYEQFVSIENAAATLRAFFNTVAEYAAGEWIHQSPMKEFQIELGELILSFECNFTEIPWAFVQNFAERMANSVRSGFAGSFDAILENVVTGGTILVRLRTMK